MPLAVIGAGLGRTGTLSLKLALEQLGVGPCYHMKEVFDRLETDVPVWHAAAQGQPVDWEALFAGYRSAVDFPAAAFWRELADRYPEAKLVLTVRDPDRWYESVRQTILRPLTESLPDHLSAWGAMVRATITERVFGGNTTDRERLIESYRRHNAEVAATIPPGRLLVYEVAQGWAPLCGFLGLPVPDQPFPRVNTTDEFRERIAPLFTS